MEIIFKMFYLLWGGQGLFEQVYLWQGFVTKPEWSPIWELVARAGAGTQNTFSDKRQPPL